MLFSWSYSFNLHMGLGNFYEMKLEELAKPTSILSR